VSEVLGLDVEGARERALEVLRDGRLLVAPTESIYALVGDAFSKPATQRLFGAKRRGRATPLTVLLRSPRQTTGMVEEIGEPAERLMAAYWPGPLTLVFRAVEGLTWDIGETHGTVALRMPTDDLLLDLVAEIGPLAVTSANRRGEPVPTTAADARRQLGLSAALYLDGGERSGPTSTVVDVTSDAARVLREGAVPASDVERVASGAAGWGSRPAPRPAEEA
jgi:tRNA threonylcarbamoyl adenosine modification protein (Sua5/YciO/YrdC/YwlC family)